MLSGGGRTREGREVGAETRVKSGGGQYHVKSLLVSVLQRSRTKGYIYKETYKELAHVIMDANRSQDLPSWETDSGELIVWFPV